MSFADKLQYNVALPGAEFRNRDLNSPVVAAQTLHEIEFGFGATREFCLSILSESFRGVDRVTQILKENSKNFRKGDPEVEEWRELASRNREYRKAIVERQMTSTAKIIENLQAKLAKLLDQQAELSEWGPSLFSAVEEVDDPQSPTSTSTTTTTSSSSSSSSSPTSSFLTPPPKKKGEDRYRYVSHAIDVTQGQIEEKEKNFETYAYEMCGYKSDMHNYARRRGRSKERAQREEEKKR